MSGINEFNDIQPEQINPGPDTRTGRKLLFSAVATALVITVAAAFGFTMNIMSKYKDDPYGILLEQVANEINLNEQQKTEVNKIKETVTAKTEGRTIKHVKGGSEIEKLFRSETFDRQKALNIANRQEKENLDLAVFMVDELEKLHSVLTSEQRNSAVDKVKELHAKFKSMNGSNKQKSKNR
jgi:Spy/CpxP family protein refolding chaperone